MKEFINIKQESDYYEKYNQAGMAYYKFGTLVFGFAPKGMVVVWLKFGYVSVQLGEFQAEVVKDDKNTQISCFQNFADPGRDQKICLSPTHHPKNGKIIRKDIYGLLISPQKIKDFVYLKYNRNIIMEKEKLCSVRG